MTIWGVTCFMRFLARDRIYSVKLFFLFIFSNSDTMSAYVKENENVCDEEDVEVANEKCSPRPTGYGHGAVRKRS